MQLRGLIFNKGRFRPIFNRIFNTLDSYLRELKFLEEEKALIEKDIKEKVLPEKGEW